MRHVSTEYVWLIYIDLIQVMSIESHMAFTLLYTWEDCKLIPGRVVSIAAVLGKLMGLILGPWVFCACVFPLVFPETQGFFMVF